MTAIAPAPVGSLRGRSLLRVADLTSNELDEIVRLAAYLKSHRLGDRLPLLAGKTLAMLFEKPSLRTRVSFEVAMNQLGGDVLFAQGNEFMVGSRETPEDAARTLSRYIDAVVVRTHAHEPLERFSAAATVPVINGLSAVAHPCQAIADILTMHERFGSLEGLRVAYIGDARNNVAVSLAEALVMSGASIHFGSPHTHRPSDAFLAHLRALAKKSGKGQIASETVEAQTDSDAPALGEGTARAFSTAIRAVRGVDVVYTDVWTSMGEEAFKERNAALLMPFAVTEELMAFAASHAIFMHCLPAHRGEEVSAGVIDGPQSAVFDQAENRLHAQKALLVALLTDRKGLSV